MTRRGVLHAICWAIIVSGMSYFAARDWRTSDFETDLLQASVQARISATADGTIVFVSASAAEVCGYEASELVGKNVDILIPDRWRERHRVASAQRVSRGPSRRVSRVTCNVLRKDGTQRTVEINVWVLAHPTRKLIQVVSLVPVEQIEEPLSVEGVEDEWFISKGP